jgi:hypothetical protein
VGVRHEAPYFDTTGTAMLTTAMLTTGMPDWSRMTFQTGATLQLEIEALEPHDMMRLRNADYRNANYRHDNYHNDNYRNANCLTFLITTF